MPRKGSRSKVTTSRVFELHCENHGVLESHRQYQRVREEREVHRALHPECFSTQPEHPAPTEDQRSGTISPESGRHAAGHPQSSGVTQTT